MSPISWHMVSMPEWDEDYIHESIIEPQAKVVADEDTSGRGVGPGILSCIFPPGRTFAAA